MAHKRTYLKKADQVFCIFLAQENKHNKKESQKKNKKKKN